MTLTQKETELLKDLKAQEQLCIDKYNKHADAAVDEQLKTLFLDFAKGEAEHLRIITEMEKGNVATLSGSNSANRTFSATYSCGDSPDKKNDNYLCSDLLTAEKHASQLYDTCIFEFCDQNARNVLNEIQKQEQNHGKLIYDYMAANCMSA